MNARIGGTGEKSGKGETLGMIWFIWSVWSIWFNQTNKTDQINKRDQSVFALQERRFTHMFSG